MNSKIQYIGCSILLGGFVYVLLNAIQPETPSDNISFIAKETLPKSVYIRPEDVDSFNIKPKIDKSVKEKPKRSVWVSPEVKKQMDDKPEVISDEIDMDYLLN